MICQKEVASYKAEFKVLLVIMAIVPTTSINYLFERVTSVFNIFNDQHMSIV